MKRKITFIIGTLLFILLLFLYFIKFFNKKVELVEKDELKYVFLIIGDGFAQNQDELLNLYLSELNEKYILNEFENKNLLTTHSLDNEVTDSAAAATAIATGNKTNNGIIGMSLEGIEFDSIFNIAKDYNYSTALLTNTRITHATPAGFYAHNTNRDNEDEIMKDLEESDIDLIIGGGNKYLSPDMFIDKNYTVLIGDSGYNNFINSNYEVNNKLIGLFYDFHAPYEPEDKFDLSDQVKESINFLSNKDKFIFVIESGNIDRVEHEKNINSLLYELYEFNEVLSIIFNFYENNSEETLMLVTGDHETGDVLVNKDTFNITSLNPLKVTGVEIQGANHTNQLVPLYYIGNHSNLFTNSNDNTDIANTLIDILKK